MSACPALTVVFRQYILVLHIQQRHPARRMPLRCPIFNTWRAGSRRVFRLLPRQEVKSSYARAPECVQTNASAKTILDSRMLVEG